MILNIKTRTLMSIKAKLNKSYGETNLKKIQNNCKHNFKNYYLYGANFVVNPSFDS